MAGKGTCDLRPPLPRFDPRNTADFETWLEAKAEDEKRTRKLRRAALAFPEWADVFLDLADRIDPKLVRRPTSQASSRRMRRHRRRLAGDLWRLVVETKRAEVTRVDILLPNQKHTPENLAAVDVAAILESFRQNLLRAGGRPKDGWLFAALHAELDASTGLIDIHLHGVASGSFLAAIDGLRRQRKYSRPRAVGRTRKPLTGLPYPLTYARQSWIPERDRNLARPPRRRMGEPAHSLVLLWMDQHPLGAFELMMGMRVIGGRLVVR